MSCLLFGCKIADLRTPAVNENIDDSKGRVILKAAAQAHGVSNWEKYATYEVDFNDQFFGFVGKNGNPFPNNEANLKLQYIPNTFNGRGIFTKGKWEGDIWGIQSWQTYEIDKGEEIEFEKEKDILFWIPTYQYFIEFPLRIQSASLISFAGTAEVEGKTCDLVFASWNTPAPQKDVDQYLIYIDQDSKLITKIDYTIREVYTWLTGTVYFKEMQEVGGIQFPFYMPVESSLVKKGLLHEMRIKKVAFNTVSKDELLPNKALEFMGDQKPN